MRFLFVVFLSIQIRMADQYFTVIITSIYVLLTIVNEERYDKVMTKIMTCLLHVIILIYCDVGS